MEIRTAHFGGGGPKHLSLSLARASAALVITFAMAWHDHACAQAMNFPNHPIRIVVGPSPDIFSRIIAEQLQETWGQPVVVEPRPGAGGKIAVATVASADPDGHTLLFASPTFTLNVAMKLATYDIMKDLEPAALIGTIAYALVVNPAVPAKSVAGLVDLAKSRPGSINCASAGNGTVPHLACETLNAAAGVKVIHVPYRDVNTAMIGTVGGHVQMFFAVATVAKQQIASRAVNGLAVTTARRSALLPDLPTMVESGFPQFVMPGWGGLMATAGTPKAIIVKINAEVQRAVARPEVRERLAAVGMEPPSPEAAADFREFVNADIARWTALVGAVGLDKLRPDAPP